MSTAEGVGAVIGSLVAAWVVARLTARRTTWTAVAVAGLFVMAAGTVNKRS